MYKFSRYSLKKLYTCHKDIRTILLEAIKFYDISVLEGLRSDERQMELYEQGRSKLDGIHKKSKHQAHIVDSKDAGIDLDTGRILVNENGEPIASLAVDIMPYKKGYNAFSGEYKDNARFYYMQGIIRGLSERLFEEGLITHKLRFGLDWDMDDIFSDQTFDDLPHFELVIK